MSVKVIEYVPCRVVGQERISEQCSVIGCRNRIIGRTYFRLDMRDRDNSVRWKYVLCEHCAKHWEW